MNYFDYFKKIDVPFEKPLPVFGNMLKLLLQKESIIEITQKSYEKFKESKYLTLQFLKFRLVLRQVDFSTSDK